MKTGVNLLSIVLNAATDDVALCAPLPFAGDAAQVPDWIHLVPAGPTIETVDGRGPWKVNIEKLAQGLGEGQRLVLDENHSTDLAAPKGLPAPAMGWIVELNARDTGLWGRVEWTDAGRALVAGRSYRAISPALAVDKATGDVRAVLRASLVNRGNLHLTELNLESDMNPLLQRLITTLGLATGTSEDALVAAVTTLHQQQTTGTVAINAIAEAAGVAKDAKADVILNAVKALKSAPGAADAKAVADLQAELNSVTTQLNTLLGDGKRSKATTVIDAAIAEGRVGVKPLRDHYITRHMADPAGVEKELNAMARLGAGVIIPPKDGETGATELNAAELQISRQLGIAPADFVKGRTELATAR